MHEMKLEDERGQLGRWTEKGVDKRALKGTEDRTRGRNVRFGQDSVREFQDAKQSKGQGAGPSA